MCDDNPLDVELKELEINDRKHSLFLDDAERSFLSQKAKRKFLNLADKNTKFFHAIIKRKQARNTLSFLCREDGQITNNINLIVENLVSYYRMLFGVAVPRTPTVWTIFEEGPRLQIEEQSTPIRAVTEEEIKLTLFDIGDEKAPGPDGFTSTFFKQNWDIVGKEVMEAVKDFFTTGQILKKINHTFISLIPKKAHDPTVSDFCLIACTNVIYKTITKILANRMSFY